eukprot:XP_011671797.1 PREDICTED: C4b-binding protein-like [Strongylocentrotus purpuratus]
MAAIKSPISVVIGFLIILCSVQHSLQDCDRPTNLDPNILIDPDQPTYGIYFYFSTSCVTGYDKTGADTFYCTFGTPDYWDPSDTSPSTLYCTAQGVPCPKPTFTGVVITPEKESYDPGERVNASCSSGTLHGDDVGLCLSDGTWDFTSDPSCQSDCQAPSNSNGTGSYTHASEVTFACIEGFSLPSGVESVAATCHDGAWSPPFACESFGEALINPEAKSDHRLVGRGRAEIRKI